MFQITITSETSNDGQYYWNIPSNLTISENYQIKIIDSSGALVFDYSDYFEIRGDDSPPPEDAIPGFELVLLLITFFGISAMLLWRKINLNAKS